MQRLNLNSVLSKFAERSSSVVANLHDFEKVNENLARVVMTFNTLDTDKESIRHAISAAFGGEVHPVENSFRQIAAANFPTLYGFVATQKVVRPFEESSSTKMKVLSSNMYMDKADESLWCVQTGANGTKMLARQNQEDLSELLASTRTRQHATPVLASVAQQVGIREYAAFVCPVSNEVRYGYVLAMDEDKVTLMPGDLDSDNTSDESRNGKSNLVTDRSAEETVVETAGDEEDLANETKNKSDMMADGKSEIQKRIGKGTETVEIDSALIIETAYVEEVEADYFAGANIDLPTDSRSVDSMRAYYKELYNYDQNYSQMIQDIINQHAFA